MLDRDGDGYLVDRDQWTRDIMFEMAQEDGFEITEEIEGYVMKAREYYDEYQVVPPIREFAKTLGMHRKAGPLYAIFQSAPMKKITKYGGLPKPTGCV